MPRICLFPGTFDPITLGHTDIIARALDLFDALVIAIGVNSHKRPMFSLEKRLTWCESVYRDEPRISVRSYEGLTVACCRQFGARYILRGIRFTADLEYEKSIADVNRTLDPSIETIFLTPTPAFSTLASTLVRDVVRYGGDAAPFLPEAILAEVKKTADASRTQRP